MQTGMRGSREGAAALAQALRTGMQPLHLVVVKGQAARRGARGAYLWRPSIYYAADASFRDGGRRQQSTTSTPPRDAGAPSTPPADVVTSGSDWVGFIVDSVPVQAMQSLLESVHDYSGLPWWASIIATTVACRSLLLPLVRHQAHAISNFAGSAPMLKELNEAFAKRLDRIKPGQFAETNQACRSYLKGLQAALRMNKVSLLSTISPTLIQIPLFVTFAIANRRMIDSGVPGLETEGLLWFTDLTEVSHQSSFNWSQIMLCVVGTPFTSVHRVQILVCVLAQSYWCYVRFPILSYNVKADPTLILPLACLISTYANIELGFSRLHESQTILRFFKDNIQLLLILFAPATASLPSGVLVYWATSTVFGHIQYFALRSPSIRAALGFPSPPTKPLVPPTGPSASRAGGIGGLALVDPALTAAALAILEQHGIQVPKEYTGGEGQHGKANSDRRPKERGEKGQSGEK